MIGTFLITLAALLGLGLGVEPSVRCPVPTSPLNGQIFLLRSGSTVKYTCNPGFVLLGTDVSRCKEDRWVPEPPTCIQEEGDPSKLQESTEQPMTSTPRPLFKWDETRADKENETDFEKKDQMQNDEARVHMMLYPERRLVTTEIRQVQTVAELEEEERRRAKEEKAIRRAPSVVYVRRPVYSGKSVSQEVPYNVITSPITENGKSSQSDDALRHIYWLAQHGYPREAAMMQSVNAHPVVMTLSESQLAWINSLYPEVRDKYLKDLYAMRAKEVEEGLRAHAYLRGYPYHYWHYNRPYYTRQPVSVIVDDPVATFDYTCHQADESGRAVLIRAPVLPNAHVYRYDKRRNPSYPRNHYLAVEYRCNPGYVLLDPRKNELYCSKRDWVGTYPICVPRA